ncbi:MAG: NUDIX domain-containing protein [Phycisphaerales bacterium]|nr:NUDIX domain-containing protein [Phycisphaerales bacterium]
MIEGVVVIVVVDQRYLMIRRAAGILAGGAWCFVGGAIDPGESQVDAVMREFREEVGGSVRPISKVWEYTRPDGRLRLHWWTAELLSEELIANPAEVQEIRWLSREEIALLENVLDSNRQYLDESG